MAPPNTAQPLLVHTPKYVYTHKEYYFHTSQMKTKLNVSYVTLDLIGLHELLIASACVCEWMYSEALSECECMRQILTGVGVYIYVILLFLMIEHSRRRVDQLFSYQCGSSTCTYL